jgi:NADH-quinone oxidoreductase subunit B
MLASRRARRCEEDNRVAAFELASGVRTTRLTDALAWAAGLSPAPLRISTSCCGMAMAQGGDFFEALGSAPPAASGRAADLLVVAGSLTRRQLPALLELYERMCEPRWVVAWGDCAISGGPYANYATISGLSRILPVDAVVSGCPPAPQALREALEFLRSGAARGGRVASSGLPVRPIRDAGTSGALLRSDSETTSPGFE